MRKIERMLQRYGHRLHKWQAIKFGRKPVVKVYGLLRTGTNYMTRLLELNFDVFCLASTEEGWKHGECKYNEQYFFVFMVKNPYSWIVSFREWEQIHGRSDVGTLTEFINSGVTQPQLNDAWSLDGPVSAWNESLRSWSKLYDRGNVIFVRYEDLIDAYDEQLKRIGSAFGYKKRWLTFKNLKSRADNWETPRPRRALSQDFYRDEEYLKSFSEEGLALMRKSLDHELVEAFKYKLI